MDLIPFNKPYLTGKEAHYIYQAVSSGKISGNGVFTKKCQNFFEESYGFKKTLMTTSCTDALEMCAILANLNNNDEVIVPSYTFVSTALPFLRERANIVFADSYEDNPNIDATKLESLITPRTKVIVPVHYAGVACDMDLIMSIARKHNILVVEDAAQAVDSFYKQQPLGSIGNLAAFSFHETKNIISGEGGLLAINDQTFVLRAEVIWEKGTNRAEFFRGEVNKYGWKDIGSSFLPSEIISAFLYAQIENMTEIQNRRKVLWNYYYANLKILEEKGQLKLPIIPEYATNNGHMFYLILESLEQRAKFISHLKKKNILSVFHYISLHESDFYKNKHDGRCLPNADKFSDTLVRLPLFYELTDNEINKIIMVIKDFFK